MPFIFPRVFFPGIVIPQIAIEGVDLLPRLECWKRSEELQKRILTGSCWAQNRPSVLEDELHTIPLIEAETMANLNRNGDLPLAANGAGWRHLYFISLQ